MSMKTELVFTGGVPDHTEVKLWYSEVIDSIRISSTPGGVSLPLDEAKDLRETLDSIIDEMESE